MNDILDEWFASEGLDEDEKITEIIEPEPEPVVEEEIIEKVKINKWGCVANIGSGIKLLLFKNHYLVI